LENYPTYLFALMKVGIINSWVLYNELERIDLEDFLKKVAKWFIAFS